MNYTSIFLGFLFLWVATIPSDSKTEYGFASIYSDDFTGSATASGERYDPQAKTCAHKELGYGSIVKVTNLDNGKSTLLTVNDRGPFIKGYVLELSRAASEELKIAGKKAKVKVLWVKEVEGNAYLPVDGGDEEDFSDADDDTPEPEPEPEANEPAPEESESVAEASEPEEDDSPKGGETPTPAETPTETITETPEKPAPKPRAEGQTTLDAPVVPLKTKGYRDFDLYKATAFRPSGTGYGVQVGSYNNLQNVLKETAKFQENWFSKILVTRQVSGGKTTYKIIIGPFDQRASADSYKRAISRKGVNGFVVAVQPKSGLDIYQFKAVRPPKSGFAVQLMSLSEAQNVVKEMAKLKQKRWFKNTLVNVEKAKDGSPRYKLMLGPFPDRNTANSYRRSLAAQGINGFVVDLSTLK